MRNPAWRRKFISADLKDRNDAAMTKRREVPEEEANLISSELRDWSDSRGPRHAPVLDIDFEAALVPSTTPGHYHLYLDKVMTWDDYAFLLKALMVTGIISKRYYAWAMSRKATFVRKPGVKKEADDNNSDDPRMSR